MTSSARFSRIRATLAFLMLVSLIALVATAGGCSVEVQPEASGATESADIRRFVGFQGAWVDTGLPFGQAPALTSWGPDRLDMFARNGDQLVQKSWSTGGGWAPTGDHYWYLASGLASDPSAVAYGGSNVDIVYLGKANNVIHTWWNGSRWTTEDLGGWVSGRPTISVAPDGTRMDVFARVGTQLWHRSWAGFKNAWANWEYVGVNVDSDPVAVSWGRGRIDIFSRANNGETRRYSWTGLGNAAWRQQLAGETFVTEASLGGFAKGLPAVVSQGAGRLDVFVQGGDDQTYRASFNNAVAGAKFTNFTAVGGCTYGTPAAAAWGTDRLDLIVRDENSHRVLHNWESAFPSAGTGPSPFCCGKSKQPTCAVGCEDGLTPSQGTCQRCGHAGEPACGTTCATGFAVDPYDSLCAPCGVSGLLSCDGACQSGTHAVGHRCIANNAEQLPWLVLLCQFSDSNAGPLSVETARQFFGTWGSGRHNMFDYWSEMSYGHADLSKTSVRGWYKTTLSRAEGNDRLKRKAKTDACTAASDRAGAGIQFTDYFGIITVYNEVSDSGAAAEGPINIYLNGRTKPYAVVAFDPLSLGVTFAAHEMGHGFGWPHSYDNTQNLCGGGPGEYCDPWDIMSAMNVSSYESTTFGTSGPGANAFNRSRRGWLGDDRTFVYDHRGQQTVTIAAVNHPEVPGPLWAKVPFSSGGNFYVLEYVRKTGFESGILGNAVLLHQLRAGSKDSFLIATLSEAQPYDDNANGVHLYVNTTDSVTSTATITFF
jgi:M6 family metalloprotease-like protein